MKHFGLITILLALTSEASTQEIELRGGVAIGSQSETYAALEFLPRVVGDVFIEYPLVDDLSAFVGGSWNNFGCEEGLCIGGVTMTGLHGIAGAGYRLWALWARAGVMYGRVRIKRIDYAGPGFYAGLGTRFRLPFTISVRPGISYRWMKMGGDGYALSLTGDLGISIPLWKGREVR